MISYHKGIIEYNVKPIPNVYVVPLCGCVVICYTNKSEKVNLGGGLYQNHYQHHNSKPNLNALSGKT